MIKMITEIRHATVSPVVKSYNCFFFLLSHGNCTAKWLLFRIVFMHIQIYTRTHTHSHAHQLAILSYLSEVRSFESRHFAWHVTPTNTIFKKMFLLDA